MAVTIRNARVIDATGADARDQQRIVIEGSAIERVEPDPGGPQRPGDVDVRGMTVLPGLVDSHIHLTYSQTHGTFAERLLQPPSRLTIRGERFCTVLLQRGITLVRDMGTAGRADDLITLALRGAVDKHVFPGPRIVACGKSLAMTGGHGEISSIIVDSADDARRAARSLLRAGVDFIKVKASGGFIHPDEGVHSELTALEMQAAVEAAHEAGKTTTTHAHTVASVRNALSAGIDCIEHGMLLDRATLELMAEAGTWFVPTLSSGVKTAEDADRWGRPAGVGRNIAPHLAHHMDVFRWALELGIPMTAGSDSLGDIVHEADLMIQGGYTHMDAIRALTIEGARLAGLADRVGTVEAGKDADLIVVDGDPLQDIDALRRVTTVVRAGRVFGADDLARVTGYPDADVTRY